ncbi:MAG: hypothetical protein H0U04_07120 [Rubrobacter sp.]|nr:hypothetical protein [Rubrobacter sp.]MBA3790941.1 hypothetical protein [Rubrobacter sp.]
MARIESPDASPLQIPLPDGLGELPAVLALDLSEQTEQVVVDTLPGLRADEAVAYLIVQLAQRLQPPGDRCGSGNPILRDHGAPFSSSYWKGSSGTTQLML